MYLDLYFVLVTNKETGKQYLLGKYKRRIRHLDEGYYQKRQAISLCDSLTARAVLRDLDNLEYSVISLEVYV